ncbi:MAG TPA: prealbumin-like fold domain-containing protein, partial [Candidatus Mediterraneibacter norfolkensis]|nr:prealbumin-like fold domain-containing protein [Candidatus Mediterraneibacter norfolkensis]
MKIVKRVLAFGLSVIMLLSTGLISLAEDNSSVPEKGTRALTIIQPEHGSLSLEGEYERQEDGAYMIVPGEEITAILETDEGWQADAIILNGEKQELADNKAIIVMPDVNSLLQAEVSEIAVDPEADEVDETEEIPQAETVDETQGDPSAGINEIALFSAGDTITSAYIKKGSEIPGSIDVTRWDGDEWTNLKNWSEGVLGTTDGEWLFCANPEQHFKEGISMTAHNASEYYSEDTIKKLCGVLYYTDQVICNRLTAEQAYMIRQGYIWTVLNEESAWYTGGDAITVEYGKGLTCACGQGISTHYHSMYSEGLDWAEEHKDQLEASGDIYVNGDNQPLSRWTYEYHPTGHVTLKKSSANPDLTNGNSCYSFEDAQYGVYKDEACQNQVGTLTVNSNGESNTIELDVGSYYVKEIKAPRGYALDGNVYPVIITEGATAKIEVEDVPQTDPVSILLGKIDQETTQNMPQGSASLVNAEFTIKFYAGSYDTNPEEAGVNPLRTWVMRTDERGFTRLGDKYKVSGDEFYKLNGVVTLPLGTLTIQETKAPLGYLVNNEIFVRQITSDGSAEQVQTYNEPTIPETVIRGGVKIEKWDNETAKHQAQGGASLEGARFQIISQNDKAVTVDGRSYNKGEVVKTLITDKTGTAVTGERDLPYGDYLIKEQTPPTGYLMEGVLEQRFSIREDGVIVNLNTADTAIRDNVIRGGVKIE